MDSPEVGSKGKTPLRGLCSSQSQYEVSGHTAGIQTFTNKTESHTGAAMCQKLHCARVPKDPRPSFSQHCALVSWLPARPG